MLLQNVELHWVKLDPANPDMGFDKNSPQWIVDVRTRNKAEADEWKAAGMNIKLNEDDNGVYYQVKVKKVAVKKDGSPNKPVPVVGRDLMPLEDITTIGNGSTANVKIHTFDYDFQGRKGTGFRLEAIQLVNHIVYEGTGSRDYGFTALEDAPASPAAEGNGGSDDDDLY